MCLGTKGNEFILNGRIQDVNAEEVYTNLCTPVFGTDVVGVSTCQLAAQRLIQAQVYDCPNSKLMEQKKFVKFGLTTQAFESYVPLIVRETVNICQSQKWFPGNSGIVNAPKAISELTIYTASRSLQGKEVRDRFDSSFADMYHDLDMGFSPINFMLPTVPFPHNRKRDAANQRMTEVYMDIIKERRAADGKQDSHDMIWNLMASVYKDGTPVPDHEVAHMMIALLMAGQHSSSATAAWIVLRLAQNPEITEELLEEQKRALGEDLPPLTYENIQKLALNNQVVKETLRLHAPIHSMIRQVKQPIHVEGTQYTIPTSHRVLSAPGVTAKSDEHFPNPSKWDPHRWDEPGEQKVEQEEEKIDYGYGMVTKGASSPYLPFGAGRHRCIGEQFAYLQLGTIIATVVRYLRFKNLNGSTDIVGTDYSSLFSRPLQPAEIHWERRESEKARKNSVSGEKQ